VAGYGPFVALLLLLLWVLMLVRLTLGRLKVMPFVAASGFMVLIVPFFWLSDGITEWSISRVGSFKTNAEQAHKYLDEIRFVRDKVDRDERAIELATKDAQNAAALANELGSKLAQADQSLQRLTEQLGTATQTNIELKRASQFATTVLAAQSDSREAYDQLEAWERDSSFPFTALAKEARSAIEQNLEYLMLEYQFPWNKTVNPEQLDISRLEAIYKSGEIVNGHPVLKIGLIQYVEKRSDIVNREKLKFFMQIMREDRSLKAVAYAGQSFARVANLDIRPMALTYFFDWWSEHQSSL
jgi:uncharacterized phage infection (PIP) family protein YhgE